MIYFLLNIIFVVLSANPIADIVMFRGDGVAVYSGSEKIALSPDKLPYSINAGEEIELSSTSDCEVLFKNNATMYIGAQTLVVLDKQAENKNGFWLKYGFIFYRGPAPAIAKTGDLSADIKNGGSILRYRPVDSLINFMNFGDEAYLKQLDDNKTTVIKKHEYFKTTAFRIAKKEHGLLDPSRIDLMYRTFKVDYVPSKYITDENIPRYGVVQREQIPKVDKINMDFTRRTLGF